MESQSLGQALHYLRRISNTAAGSPLDAELIERFVAADDGAAFARLVERHGPLVLGVCRRVLCHHHDAEDVFQATFLVLARNARRIRRRDALPGWLYKVAYHLAVKVRASARRREQAERDPSRLTPTDDAGWSELHGVLDEELNRLPEKYRTPVLLCCLAGRTRDEAAEQLGWTLGTLKMRLERARQLLRTRLARRGLGVSAAMMAPLLGEQASAAPVSRPLATTTLEASLQFAAGKSTGLPARVLRLTSIGVSATSGKVKLLGPVIVVLSIISMTVGLLLPSRAPEPLRPAEVEVAAVSRAPLVTDGRFADATDEAGLGAILAQHYARFRGWQPTGATLLDVDGDDKLDLHLAGQSAGPAALCRNVGGRFTYVNPQPEIPRGVREYAELPYPGGQVRHAFDFNEDGALDLAISWHNNGGALYHNKRGESTPRFRRAKFVQSEFPDIRASALADVNRDGVVDLLTSDNETDVAIHFGRRDGTFRATPGAHLHAGLQCAGAIPIDLDGDGQLELITRQTEFNVPVRRKLFRSVGPTKWADATRQMGLNDKGSVHGVGDVNQDGSPDLIGVEGQKIVIYLNDGRGHFRRRADAIRGLERATEVPHPEWGAAWGGAVVVDFDNDGIPDVIINGKYFLYVLRGVGGGTFEYMNDRWGLPDYSYSDVDYGFCFGDVDGDGRLDLVAGRGEPDFNRRPVGLFLNRVADQPWLRVRLAGQAGNASATGAKIRVYDAGRPGRLIAYEQVAVWGRQSFHSYYAARQTERHFGLGQCSAVDVSVEFYPSGRRVEQKNVPADGTIVIAEQDP